MKVRPVVLLIALLLALAGFARAQAVAEGAPEPAHGSAEEEHHDSSTFWKTVNFAILAAAIGYGMAKFGGAFFRSRTAEIQSGIAEATRLRQEAEARAADMERRMANLSAEVEELRRAAREELEAEERRFAAETEQLVVRMQANAEQEIASAANQARKELRAYSAELALELARRKIQSRMTPELADDLVDAFVRDLDRLPQRVK
ncbi:MAG: hypothetical protein KIT09_21795 [Bryobacteraceae bacterium]|nr:hypothetical protein [Bryobacteraceae bacterium]